MRILTQQKEMYCEWQWSVCYICKLSWWRYCKEYFGKA